MLKRLLSFVVLFLTLLIGLAAWNTEYEVDLSSIDQQIKKVRNPEGFWANLKYKLTPEIIILKEENALKMKRSIAILENENGFFKRFISGIWDYARPALFLAVAITCIPYACKLFLYYVVAPGFVKRKQIQLFEEDTEEKPHGISFSNEEKSLNVCIPSGASLIVKQGYINGYLDDSSNSLKKTTEWLFDWSYPVMSYICGLYGMTKFRNTLQSKEQCVNITSNCPDEYFVEISFAAGSEVYIVPSAIVAYSGSLKLKRHWRIFNAMAWCMGQISYFTLSGTGKCVIKGLGGIKINKTIDNELHKRKFRSILMASLNENMRVVRTETFFPYFSGKEELFDLQLQGNGVFISKNTVMEGENKTGITRLRDSFFAAIGKVLGF